MNVREEDRQKNSCPSRGLGLAAAAIGVGVGAALYYIFSKRTENPDGEGSTTSGWTCEQPHSFEQTDDHEDSFTTISENSTSDTSVHDSDSYTLESGEESDEDSSGEDSNTSQESSDFSSEIDDSFETNYLQTSYDSNNVPNLELEISMEMEWDVTNSSADVPEFELPRGPVYSNLSRAWPTKDEERLRQQALYEEEQLRILREEAYRERTWSLEECSICFDIILKDQDVTTLPCTHHFHSACIAPWLQEQQTCPNCRKAAE